MTGQEGIIIDAMPLWLELALVGPLLVYFIAVAGITITKAGHHPGWALLLLVPYVQLIVIWWFALKKWPRRQAAGQISNDKNQAKSKTDSIDQG